MTLQQDPLSCWSGWEQWEAVRMSAVWMESVRMESATHGTHRCRKVWIRGEKLPEVFQEAAYRHAHISAS